MADILSWTYVMAVSLLSVYGLLGILTLWLYWRHKDEVYDSPVVLPEKLPKVTVQLPIFNEKFVVERLIKSAINLDYPSDRLQIQLIDDSTDDTSLLAARLVAHYQGQNINIEHIQRSHRAGYKAGALAEAMRGANGEFLALFDADFQPEPDFLIKTIPHFLSSPDLGMIQARWGHLNAEDSPLTAAQSIALDKHFVMEQTVRHRANLFPKFNGAAGVWRRECVDDAGGWLDDTVCEDLCLSTRAVLKGWRFQFLVDVVAPAELPDSITAYKNQQARWAKGSIQCLNKYSGEIARDRNYSLTARLYAIISMSAYATHLLLLLLLFLQIPLLILDVRLPPIMLLFTIIGIGQPMLFILAQKVSYSNWRHRLLHFPTLLLIAVGTAPSNSRAILQAFFGRQHSFVRTPKGMLNLHSSEFINDSSPYKLPFDGIWLTEVFLAAYAAVGIALAVDRGNPGPLFLLLTSLLGFSYVAWLGLRDISPRWLEWQRRARLKLIKNPFHGRDIS